MKRLISLVLALAIFIMLPIPAFAESDSQSTYLASSNTCLAFRDAQGKLIKNMPEGEVFIVLGTDPRDSERIWVNWNGTEGSIIVRETTKLSNTYLASDILDSTELKAFTTRELNLRNKNTYEIILTIPAGSYVSVIGNDPYNSDRLVVNFFGVEGTILEDGLFFTRHADYVLVDINTQTISLFKNGKIVLVSKVVTGYKDYRDTPRGFFSIEAKVIDTRLVGADYDVPVKYWMPFFNGCGLHDATWRSSFGGTIYTRNGSHGCVNMCLEAAKYIYDNVYVGIPVIVC